MAEIELDQKALEAGWWHYKINYGPNGEENYANVYDASGELVSNLKIHHAREIVGSMNDIRLAATRHVSDEVVEAAAKAIYESWANYPACTDSKPWEVESVKMPGKARHFREHARAALSAALAHTGKPTVKPLDLSNLLKHAFSAGYTSAAGDDGWTDYDPTTCPAFERILSALQAGGET